MNHAFENSTLELFIELSWDNPNWMSKGQSLRHSNDFCFCDSPMKYFAACLTIVRLSYFAERISFFFATQDRFLSSIAAEFGQASVDLQLEFGSFSFSPPPANFYI